MTLSKEHLISSAPLPEVCGQELWGKGSKRGRFGPCWEHKIGEGFKDSVSFHIQVSRGSQVGATVLTLVGAGGRVSR